MFLQRDDQDLCANKIIEELKNNFQRNKLI